MIKRDCASWNADSYQCNALIELICSKRDECPFYVTEEQKKEKDRKTEERLMSIAGLPRVDPVAIAREANISRDANKENERNRFEGQAEIYPLELTRKRRLKGVCICCGGKRDENNALICTQCRAEIMQRNNRNIV